MCPVGEGAAAVLASAETIGRLGLDASRAVRVLSSVQQSDELYGTKSHDAELTRAMVARAPADAGVAAADLDVVQLHDALAIEESQYPEAMGICGDGEAPGRLRDGESGADVQEFD